ncbi:MAG TPA: hypothetical protein VH813_07595 [Candidatus Limnocylindrales bacterium]
MTAEPYRGYVVHARRSNHLRVAFASERHARYALQLLASLGDGSIRTSVEDDASLTILDLELGSADPERVATLMRGAHGITIDPPAAVAAEVA